MITGPTADPTPDRLLRHMARANAALAARCAAYDARIGARAAAPDGPADDPFRGNEIRARSTILDHAIRRATERRARIAGALATDGIDAIDLDALDVWADAGGLGHRVRGKGRMTDRLGRSRDGGGHASGVPTRARDDGGSG